MSWVSRFSTLQIALGTSLVVHAALLGVRFVNPEGFNRVFQDTPLEVILVNGRSAEAPPVAQAMAQANLAGGGDLERGRATSPLPPSPTLAVGDSDEDARRQVEQLEQTQQQLLAHLRKELAALPPPDPQRDKGSPQETAQEDKRRKLVEQLAEIEKSVKEYNARPKKRFVSPATQEEFSAIYRDQIRRLIESRGTRNFPTQNGKKLYGELILSATIDAAGRVVDTEIEVPSTSRTLDRQAIAIVLAAAPFEPFNRAIRQKADLLVFTWKFTFNRDGALEATLIAR